MRQLRDMEIPQELGAQCRALGRVLLPHHDVGQAPHGETDAHPLVLLSLLPLLISNWCHYHGSSSPSVALSLIQRPRFPNPSAQNFRASVPNTLDGWRAHSDCSTGAVRFPEPGSWDNTLKHCAVLFPQSHEWTQKFHQTQA